jgi:uncharacterized phage-like protein YoqJ
MILAVCGHRPVKLGGYRVPNPIYTAVREGLRQKFLELSPSIVLSGMALGVDQWAAEICIEEGIPFDAIIPFDGFESRWPYPSKQQYHYLLGHARDRHIVTQTREYRSGLLQIRNRWLVNHSERLVAVWNGSSGGTSNCVSYAQTRGKPITRLDLPSDVWAAAAASEGRGYSPQILRVGSRSEEEVRALRDAWINQMNAPTQILPIPEASPQPFRRGLRRRRDQVAEVTEGEQDLRLISILNATTAPNLVLSDEELAAQFANAVEALGRYQASADSPAQVAPAPTKPTVDVFKPGRIIDLDD